MDGYKEDLEFKVFMQHKPTRKKCKRVIKNVLSEYAKSKVNSSEVDNYFSMFSRFGYRLQKQRDNFYRMNITNKDEGLPLKDILDDLGIKSSYN
jgi:hypothetical protein